MCGTPRRESHKAPARLAGVQRQGGMCQGQTVSWRRAGDRRRAMGRATTRMGWAAATARWSPPGGQRRARTTVRASRRPWQGGGATETIECGVRGAVRPLRPKQALCLDRAIFKLLEQKFGTRCEAQPVLRFTPLYCISIINSGCEKYCTTGK